MTTLEERVLASGLLPDRLLRRIIRTRVEGLQERFDRLSAREEAARQAALVAELESGPITVDADEANRQHYELPPALFRLILGPRLKYSCCYWPDGVGGLAQAEEAMLKLTAERAGLADGQDILDLGCGWGSLAVWAAECYPNSRVTAMSNSHAQRAFIEDLCRYRRLGNLKVVTAEVGSFEPGEHFDRVVAVEMLEHLRNHRALLKRVADWLKPGGKLFVHTFCHRRHFYTFEPGGDGGWMAERFFSGGVMPSWDYLSRYQDILRLAGRWKVNGRHYSRTLQAWLNNLDRHHADVKPLLEEVHGCEKTDLWFAYWRVFFMTCEETFALDSGRSYFVGHYLFSKGAS